MENKDLKILCVDDEQHILELYDSIVKDAGYTAVICSSPTEASKIIEAEHAKTVLILCDYKMPEMMGFEFRSRMSEQAKSVPFVMVSAFVTKEMALEALDLKIDAFVDKPMEERLILEVIEKYATSRTETIRENEELETIFYEEVVALLEEMGPVLLALETDRTDNDRLNFMYRSAHTIKGSSGFLSSDVVTRYVHSYEDIIGAIKKCQLQFSDDIYDMLLRGFDRIKELVHAIPAKQLHVYSTEVLLKELNYEEVPTETSKAQLSHSGTVGNRVDNLQKAKENIPVPIEMLERLSSSSGEITVLRNMVNKLIRSLERENTSNKDIQNLKELLDEMHKINSTIQNNINELRKVPISGVLKPIPRIIRDASKVLGKQVVFKSEGDSLRIDTALASILSNSLVHLVRNSIDHGIETPELRSQQSKPESGTLTVIAKQQGDDIYIEVSDDGSGIDAEKIKSKAYEKGIFTKKQLSDMSLEQAMEIIFQPGLSTAEKVSDLSGRGVGMDMVKSSVESIGGRIQISSKLLHGTTFKITLPVPKSVLIITSLLVEAGGHEFAVPQDSIKKVLRIEPDKIAQMVQMVSLGPTLRCDDKVYPLISLGGILKLENDSKEDFLGIAKTAQIILLKCERGEFGLLVDKINDAEEIVVKPVQAVFNHANAFLGATFLGDGSVGLILNVNGVAELAGILASEGKIGADLALTNDHVDHKTSLSSKEHHLILFEVGSNATFAVPLEQIFRLEELDNSKIQRSGLQEVIIYRDCVMPLYPCNRLLGLKKSGAETDVAISDRAVTPTIVTRSNDGYLGLQVDSIIDIATTTNEVCPNIRDRIGIVGNTMIKQRNVTVLDLPTILNNRLNARHG